MFNQNFRTISLVICTFIYLFIGAAVFEAIESTNEQQTKRDLSRRETEWRKKLTKLNITDDEFDELAVILVSHAPYKDTVQWKFAGAFYFVTTVITTIGFGHIAPKTIAGRLVCLIYAAFGVPLNVITLQSVGERINEFVTFLLAAVKRQCRRRRLLCSMFRSSPPSCDVTPVELMATVATLSIVLILWCAWGFSYFEEWTYFDSFYYCIITLTTIGFGDYVAMNSNSSIQTRPDYVTFGLIFIFIGLAFLSSAINLIVTQLNSPPSESADKKEAELACIDPYGQQFVTEKPEMLAIDLSCPVTTTTALPCWSPERLRRVFTVSGRHKDLNGCIANVDGDTNTNRLHSRACSRCTSACDQTQCCHL